jgi:glycosyltransferase involved in cell wall biosynthesis
MGDPYTVNNPCTKRMSTFRKEMESQGHTVYTLAPETQGVEHEDNIIYCKTPPMKKKTTLYRMLNSMGLAISSIKEAKKIKDIDVVLTTCPPPLINMAGWYIAKSHKAKLVYDVRDVWPDVALEMGSFSDKSIYARVFAYIRNFMLKKADLVTAVSPGKVRKLKGYSKKDNIVQISNGYNVEFKGNKINEELYKNIKSKGSYICIYIGNLGLAQGLSQLLNIAAKCMEQKLDATFILYGSGAEEKQLKEYVEENNLLNVYFEGRLPNKDMYTVLKATDLSFVPLVSENLNDSIPTKLYEALGVGCPVLLAAAGDSADILNETGLGIAVKPNDDKVLWNAFTRLHDNRREYEQYKDNAVHLMETKYSLQTSAKRMISEIEKIFISDSITKETELYG